MDTRLCTECDAEVLGHRPDDILRCDLCLLSMISYSPDHLDDFQKYRKAEKNEQDLLYNSYYHLTHELNSLFSRISPDEIYHRELINNVKKASGFNHSFCEILDSGAKGIDLIVRIYENLLELIKQKFNKGEDIDNIVKFTKKLHFSKKIDYETNFNINDIRSRRNTMSHDNASNETLSYHLVLFEAADVWSKISPNIESIRKLILKVSPDGGNLSLNQYLEGERNREITLKQFLNDSDREFEMEPWLNDVDFSIITVNGVIELLTSPNNLSAAAAGLGIIVMSFEDFITFNQETILAYITDTRAGENYDVISMNEIKDFFRYDRFLKGWAIENGVILFT